jgi:hypothetical protein
MTERKGESLTNKTAGALGSAMMILLVHGVGVDTLSAGLPKTEPKGLT